MCGRYAMAISPSEIPQYFGEQEVHVDQVLDQSKAHPRYNIGPAQYAPVYYCSTDESVVRYMKWGMIPIWTKRISDYAPFKTFNAKSESITEGHRIWKRARAQTRCVVPMTGYYEWLVEEGVKIPYYVHRKDRKLMFLAGLWDKSMVSDEESTETIYSFTIVTGPAPEQLKWLHHRMPIVLEPGTDLWEQWLNPNTSQWSGELAKCLKPYRGAGLEWYEVTRDVGNVRNEGEYLTVKLESKPLKKTQSILQWTKRVDPLEEVKEEIKEEDEDCKTPDSPSNRFLYSPVTPTTSKKRDIADMLVRDNDKRQKT